MLVDSLTIFATYKNKILTPKCFLFLAFLDKTKSYICRKLFDPQQAKSINLIIIVEEQFIENYILHSIYYSRNSLWGLNIYIGWSWLGFYIIYWIEWYCMIWMFSSYWSPCFYVMRFSKKKNLGHGIIIIQSTKNWKEQGRSRLIHNGCCAFFVQFVFD